MTKHASLAAALVAAQSKMTDPRLTGENPHFRSKFVPRDEALDCVLPALHAEGLALVQAPCSSAEGVGVRTLLFHADSGESFDFGPFCVTPAKADPQGEVAATTYASRTGIMLVCARAGDPDDDGNTASAKGDAPKSNPLKEQWEKVVKAMGDDDARKAAVKARLGNPKTQAAALAAFIDASEAERVAVWTLANGGEVS